MEPFDGPVGLRPVRARLLRPDAELRADVTAEVGFVRRSVIGQVPFHGHAAGSKPGHGSQQHSDSGCCGFVLMDLGMSYPGVVIEDGVDERGPDLGLTMGVTWLARGCFPVAAALLPAHMSQTAAVGDIAEFLYIDMDQRPGYACSYRRTISPVLTST